MQGAMSRVQGKWHTTQEIDEALAACAWVLKNIESHVTIEYLVSKEYENQARLATTVVDTEHQQLIDDVRDVMQNLQAGHDPRDLNAQAVVGSYQPSDRFGAWLTRETRPHNLAL